jgi:hypothetical protein
MTPWGMAGRDDHVSPASPISVCQTCASAGRSVWAQLLFMTPPHRRARGGHAAGCLSGVRSSCTKHRITIPTMYVVLNTVSAVANPALSMR